VSLKAPDKHQARTMFFGWRLAKIIAIQSLLPFPYTFQLKIASAGHVSQLSLSTISLNYLNFFKSERSLPLSEFPKSFHQGPSETDI
jgi:hypothetical protein